MTAPLEPGYISLDMLKDALSEQRDIFDDLLNQAIYAASRLIDNHCNDQFWQDPTPTTRQFRSLNPRVMRLTSFESATGMVVSLDTDDDGIFETTLTADQWAPVKPDTYPDRPWNAIRAMGSLQFPGAARASIPFASWFGRTYDNVRLPRAQVTTRWGWATTPAPIAQACQILAIDYYKSKDLTGGIYGDIRLSGGKKHLPPFNALAAQLLADYQVLTY